MAIGERIRRARVDAGFHSGARFARTVGIRPETLNRIEHGHCQPSLETVDAIARQAGVSLDWIVRGDEPLPAATGTEG